MSMGKIGNGSPSIVPKADREAGRQNEADFEELSKYRVFHTPGMC